MTLEEVEIYVCPSCGGEFIKNARARTQVYCSRKCQSKFSYYKKHPRVREYSPEILQWLEKRNIENFVHFYAPGLLHIQRTGKAPQGWSHGVRRSARRYGLILPVNPRIWRSPWKITLSPVVLELLENGDEGGDSN